MGLGQIAGIAAGLLLVASGRSEGAEMSAVTLRGREQRLHLYGAAAGPPVLVTSGDGGWVHLAPRIAELLAARGYAVAGLDAKAYLSSFTKGSETLAAGDVSTDFRQLVGFARHGRTADRVLLVGISEGAGLSVLAAANAGLQSSIQGVLGLGLLDENELGWRFRDSIIYWTKGIPREPLFRASDFIPRLGPVPLAEIHSTADEFAPLAKTRLLMQLPGGPKRQWVVTAADHRFSDDQGGLERSLDQALAWIEAERP
jgi:Bacterial virulence protein (VirJ)